MTTTGFDDNLIGDSEVGAQKKTTSQLLSVEGIMMLFIASVLDLLGYLSIGFYIAFGFGVVMGRIVSVVGFIIIGAWQFLRSGSLPTKGAKGKTEGAAGKLAKKFLKKHWKKLVAEGIIGDFWPAFVMIVYSELK